MSDEIQTFRQELRDWLADNCPETMRGRTTDDSTICWGGRRWQFTSEDQRLWLERMAERGLTAPRWPRTYGGGGLDRAQEKILHEEMDQIEARSPLESFGLWMLGPALLQFGSEAQKLAYLPPITCGEIRWCQGYSEPGAGSDLAGVRTRAVEDGDDYIVNGQKIWTSYADQADMIFALVRTDADAPKHKGLSFLLIDMATTGITTRPIKLISGKSPFCETFFDDVRVPKANIVGVPGQGWEIARYLLTHEREMIGAGAGGLLGARSLGAVLAESGEMDATLRAAAMRCEIDTLAVELTIERYKDQAEAGNGVGDASAMLKYVGTELNKRRYDMMMEAAGSEGLAWQGRHGGMASEWLRAKANSIEGGTSEIMLGIISKRILEMPG